MKDLRGRLMARRERGAVAVVLAIVMLVLMAAAALGMDIARLAYERQALRAAIDAASQAGSYALPDATAAIRDAKDFAIASAPDLGLNKGAYTSTTGTGPFPSDQVNVSLYCTIAVKAGTNTPDENQVPTICNPGTAWAKGQPAAGCNGTICVLPCSGTGAACNTIKVSYQKTVQFSFAPAIGIDTGSTGSMSSASCKGMCGAIAPNPLDIVVMADRTPSMSDDYITNTLKKPALVGAYANMQKSLKDMLITMNRDQQYVAFGTIAKSTSTGTCATMEPSSTTFSGFAFAGQSNSSFITPNTYSTNKVPQTGVKWTFNGSWVPVGFSNTYTTGSSLDGTLAVNTSSALWKAIDCMGISDSTVSYPAASSGYKVTTNEGTHLAAAMKGAIQYITNSANLSGLPSRAQYGTPKKVIIFETDGAPSELLQSHSDAMLLTNNYDIGYTNGADVGNGEAQSCKNLLDMAQKAKDLGIKIITIGVGSVNTATCGTQGNVRDVLAKVASPKSDGTASDALNCELAGNSAAENSDGDSYFCAASAGDLSSIFAAAVASITGNTKYIRVPGISE